MALLFNFKMMEVMAPTKEEAFVKAPFYVAGDASQKFREWRDSHRGVIDENVIKQFCLEYLSWKSKNSPGVGYFITLDSPKIDTRERPWKIQNVKGKGRKKWGKVFQLIGNGNVILGEAIATKDNARTLAKQIMRSGYKGDIDCIETKQVISGEKYAFRASYMPSKGFKEGRWLLFGIEGVV